MTRGVSITKEQLLEVYVVRGLTAPEAAAELGVHYQTIHNLLRRYDIPRRKTGVRRDPALVAQRDALLLKDFDAGKPVTAIARRFRLSRQGVYDVLKRHGR
jgi:transposase